METSKVIVMNVKAILNAAPFTPKEAAIGGTLGGIVGLFVGPFGLLIGALSLGIAYYKKSYKIAFFAMANIFMGFAYVASSTLIEFMPSPMLFMTIPTPQTIVKNTVITKTSQSGIAEAFRIVDGVPSSVKAGDVWYNMNDTQYEGYDGNDVVILG